MKEKRDDSKKSSRQRPSGITPTVRKPVTRSSTRLITEQTNSRLEREKVRKTIKGPKKNKEEKEDLNTESSSSAYSESDDSSTDAEEHADKKLRSSSGFVIASSSTLPARVNSETDQDCSEGASCDPAALNSNVPCSTVSPSSDNVPVRVVASSVSAPAAVGGANSDLYVEQPDMSDSDSSPVEIAAEEEEKDSNDEPKDSKSNDQEVGSGGDQTNDVSGHATSNRNDREQSPSGDEDDDSFISRHESYMRRHEQKHDESDDDDYTGTSNVNEQISGLGQQSRARRHCERESGLPADSNEVVYLDGMPEPKKWTDQKCHREKERCIPQVRCRVKPLRNGGIMLFDFETESDVSAAFTFDWETPIDGDPPFGGVSKKRRKILGRPVDKVRVVRMVVEEDAEPSWIAEQLEEDGLGRCTVEEVGNPFGRVFRGVRKKALRVTMPGQKEVGRIVRKGVRIGGRLTVATPWMMYQATLLCTRCQRRNCSRATCPMKVPRCARCAGAHETKNCNSSEFFCCWCSEPHAATYSKCSVRLEFLRAFAHRTGLPLPSYATFVSQEVIPSRFDGRSYSAVGSRSKQASRQDPAPELASRTGAEFPHLPSRRQVQPRRAPRENPHVAREGMVDVDEEPAHNSLHTHEPPPLQQHRGLPRRHQQYPVHQNMYGVEQPSSIVKLVQKSVRLETEPLIARAKSIEATLQVLLSTALECISLLGKQPAKVDSSSPEREIDAKSPPDPSQQTGESAQSSNCGTNDSRKQSPRDSHAPEESGDYLNSVFHPGGGDPPDPPVTLDIATRLQEALTMLAKRLRNDGGV